MRILITGGCGFIGSHFVERLLKQTDWEIVVLDRLSYASNGLDRLRDFQAFDEKRVSLFTADFTKPITEGLAREVGQVDYVDYIVHMGAETHACRSTSARVGFASNPICGRIPSMRRREFLSAAGGAAYAGMQP